MYWLLLASLLAADPAAATTAEAPQPSQTEEEKKKLEEEISKELGTQPGKAAAQPPVAARTSCSVSVTTGRASANMNSIRSAG
jgi:hypothetical protein